MTEHPDPETDAALADLLDVSRRRIYTWRAAGAPKGRTLADWRAWLIGSGRLVIAARIHPDTLLARGVREAPAGAGETAPDDDAEDDDADTGEQPPADATLTQQERHWKVRAAKAKALALERADAERRRELIPIADVRRIATAIAAGMVASLADTVWQHQRPLLDGIALSHPDLIRRLRAEHDAGVVAIRAKAARAIADELRKLTKESAHG